MCYWCMVSFGAWALLSLVGTYWSPLRGSSGATVLLAAAIGCFANWLKNRTFHCSITAWIFLAGGLALLAANTALIEVEPRLVWLTVAVGTGVAFYLEWQYARRSR